VASPAIHTAATKHGHLREMGVPILFGAVVLLVSAALMLGANISALRGNLDWMDHSQQVLNQIDVLETCALGEELSVRGLALTGDTRFFRFQQRERKRCQGALQAFSGLAAAEPVRQAEFRTIMQNVVTHMALFGRLSTERPDRAEAVARAILDPVVRENMRKTRLDLAHLRTAEMREFATRQHDITNQLSRAFFLAMGIIITAFLLGGIGVWAAQIKTPVRR